MEGERLSQRDDSLFASHAEHIQRYEFALGHCSGKRVLDAGCGIGYGSYFLATNGAKSVLGVDISDDALAEARANYRIDNLRFEKRDVEKVHEVAQGADFDVVVNFENLEHLQNPAALVSGVASIIGRSRGTFVTSTPNGAISELDEHGKPKNIYHVKEYTTEELEAMLSPHFDEIALYGQWLTHAGRLRKIRAQQLFEQLCDAYYNPIVRFGRTIKKAMGKETAVPPEFTAGRDSFPGDHAIRPLSANAFLWPPEVLIAVCKKK